jgi:DNA-binding transcriptional ArsR family regulator
VDDILKAVATPRRRLILKLIWTSEKSAGRIAEEFDVTFAAVSQHLRVLREAGLVEVRRVGRHRFYRARPEALGPLAQMLMAEWSGRLTELKRLAEEETTDAG